MNIFEYLKKIRGYRKELLGLVAVLFVLAIATGVIAVRGIVISFNEQVRPTIAVSEDHTFWQERIREMGGKQAYDDFSVSVEGMQRDRQHEKAHVFGGALYLEEGVDGLAVCDSRFNYGCFHEFLGRAITELGVNSIPQLNQICIQMLGDDAGFCQHGVGHGIQSYFGYGPKDFDQAIELCSSLPGNDPIGGCAGGIYMEYNLRFMLAEDRAVRESDDIFSPCSRLKPEYLSACYYTIGQWWYEHLVYELKSPFDIYTTMGERCSSIDERFRADCYRGIGNLLHEGESDRSPEFCKVVSPKKEYQKMCEMMTH